MIDYEANTEEKRGGPRLSKWRRVSTDEQPAARKVEVSLAVVS